MKTVNRVGSSKNSVTASGDPSIDFGSTYFPTDLPDVLIPSLSLLFREFILAFASILPAS